MATSDTFDILIIGQAGRLQYEAALFAASLRRSDPGFAGQLYVAEPQPNDLWPRDPRMSDAVRDLLVDELGGTLLPFESRHFGAGYPYGNKIEALLSLPPDRPFVFFDSDTLVTGPLSEVPFDFDRPCASLRREGTWPQIELYGPGYAEIWRSLYDKFGLDFDSSIDPSQPDEYWERYLYFNAGWFFHRSGPEFGQRFLDYALAIRDDAPETLALQSLDPWLDQVALPLVIHSFGGGRQTIPAGLLDGATTCHYRLLPLLYAREGDHVVETLEATVAPNKLKKILKEYEPIKRMVLQGRGRKARALFDQDDLPRKEQKIRNRLKSNGFWMR
ncbi:hypothetical protein SAMN04488012_109134 [Palleronia salina]|uniref:Uncharacterized protein n=1 Tax=Palleronia salina TaxID=313368 RepID=A0A1M6JE67_9RHOB|nr:hypothetical protein [Palleronia salina]SHJ45013.1 hypothetical protein SAMN04488012_109134 [Palleronia salina]